jgi:hypothetical protein
VPKPSGSGRPAQRACAATLVYLLRQLILGLAKGGKIEVRGHGWMNESFTIYLFSGMRTITLISKPKPESQLTPTAVQFA